MNINGNLNNVSPNSPISNIENSGASIKNEKGNPSTGVNESNLGTNLTNASNPTHQNVSATLVSSFGFDKGKAEIVENLMNKFCTKANYSLKEYVKIKSGFFDNLKTLFAKIVDFFKGNDAEIQKRQAKGWRQFDNLKDLFVGNPTLREEVLLPIFKNGSVEEQFALLKMFHDKPAILSSLLSQPEFKEMINRCYHEMGAVNFYNTFKEHILNNEMPWLDKSFYAAPSLGPIKDRMSSEEKDKFSTAAFTLTEEQFQKSLEVMQLGGMESKEEDKANRDVEKMVSFLSSAEEGTFPFNLSDPNMLAQNSEVQLFKDLGRQVSCSITIGNTDTKIILPHASKEKSVTVKEILESLKQQVKKANLDENAIKKLSEFVIKTPSQGYLSAKLEFSENVFPYMPIATGIPFGFEVNLEEDQSSVRVKIEGECFTPECSLFPGQRIQQRDVFDYTLNLDHNDLSQVTSVQINKYEQKILGIIKE